MYSLVYVIEHIKMLFHKITWLKIVHILFITVATGDIYSSRIIKFTTFSIMSALTSSFHNNCNETHSDSMSTYIQINRNNL